MIIALVVQNTGGLTTLDEAIEDQLIGLGHTVVLVTDNALATNVSGKDAIVITFSARDYEMSNWNGYNLPVLCAGSSDFWFSQGFLVSEERGFEETTSLDLETHAITTGITSPAAIYSGVTFVIAQREAGREPGLDSIAHFFYNGSEHDMIYIMESGVTKADAATCSARTVLTSIFRDSAESSLTSVAWDLFDNSVAWILDTGAPTIQSTPIMFGMNF